MERADPKRLLIIGKPKVGKTASLEFLGDEDKKKALILDLEEGSAFINGYKIHVIGLRPPVEGEVEEIKQKRLLEKKYYLTEVAKDILDQKKETGEYPFKYVVVDTVTKLEDYCADHATEMYMFQSLQGKTFNRDKAGNMLPRKQWTSVLTTAQGNGYRWLRESFAYWLGVLDMLAPHIILIGHIKDKNMDTEEKSITVDEIDLTGKIRRIIASSCDAIGVLYRKKNKTIVSFASDESECGARCPHLRNKEVVLLESDSNGQFKGGWNEIYVE